MSKKMIILHTPNTRRRVYVDPERIESIIEVPLGKPEEKNHFPTALEIVDGPEIQLTFYGSQVRMYTNDYGVVEETPDQIMEMIALATEKP